MQGEKEVTMTSRLENVRGLHLFLKATKLFTWQTRLDFTKCFKILQLQVLSNLQRECEVSERCNCDPHRLFHFNSASVETKLENI